jgi:hypothetical protein
MEYWSTGMMEYWVLGKWDIGTLEKFIVNLVRKVSNIKNDGIVKSQKSSHSREGGNP